MEHFIWWLGATSQAHFRLVQHCTSRYVCFCMCVCACVWLCGCVAVWLCMLCGCVCWLVGWSNLFPSTCAVGGGRRQCRCHRMPHEVSTARRRQYTAALLHNSEERRRTCADSRTLHPSACTAAAWHCPRTGQTRSSTSTASGSRSWAGQGTFGVGVCEDRDGRACGGGGVAVTSTCCSLHPGTSSSARTRQLPCRTPTQTVMAAHTHTPKPTHTPTHTHTHTPRETHKGVRFGTITRRSSLNAHCSTAPPASPLSTSRTSQQ